MGNLLTSSKKKGPAINDTDRVILSLKTQKKKLEDQDKLINARLERYGEVARQLVGEGRRDRALLALKKKKLSEKQQEGLHSHIINLENMLMNIESTKTQSSAFAVLQKGNDELKALQAQVRLEDVQKLMDETAEAAAYQAELQEMLGQQLTDVDDQEVEAEMAALEQVVGDEEALSMPAAPKVPAAAAQAQAQQAAGAEAGQTAQQATGEAAAEQPRRAEPMLAS